MGTLTTKQVVDRCVSRKNKVPKHIQYKQIQVIYFQTEAPTTDFKYFHLYQILPVTAFVLLIGHSIIHSKTTDSFSTNRSTFAQNTAVMALQQIRCFSDYHCSFIPLMQNHFIFPECRGWLWEPPTILSDWLGGFSPGVKRPGYEVKHSPLSSAKIMNAWSDVFSPPYAFVMRSL
jgi:hypothetical protein